MSNVNTYLSNVKRHSYAEISLTKTHARHASHTTTDMFRNNNKMTKTKIGKNGKKMIGKVWFGVSFGWNRRGRQLLYGFGVRYIVVDIVDVIVDVVVAECE